MPELNVKHKGDMFFETTVGGHTLRIDVPPEMDGKDRSLTPPDLFLASLASCILAFVVNYCNNVGIDTEDISVDLSYDELEDPERFANLKVAIKIPKGDYVSHREAILRAVEQCPVYETIRAVDYVETVIEESKEAPMAMVSELDPGFKYDVVRLPGGENVRTCFACGICSASCPVGAIEEKYNPRKIIRMVLLGMKERVLASDFVWLCSSCYICNERCPRDVRLADIMTVLKNMAVKEGYIHSLYKEQMRLLTEYGTVYEVDNERREKYGLPPIHTEAKEMQEIFRVTGVATEDRNL